MTDGSEIQVVPVCPPVVEYSCEFQARAADELGLLPEGLAIVEMLGDYAVMRDQARACWRFRPRESPRDTVTVACVTVRSAGSSSESDSKLMTGVPNGG